VKLWLGSWAVIALALLAVGGAAAGAEQRPVLKIALTSGGEVTTSDGRVQCYARCKTRYRRGTILRLTAKPDENYRFDRWEGGCIGAARVCDVALDRALSVRARFVGAPAIVLLSVGGPGNVSSPSGLSCGAVANLCRLEAPYASSITLRPDPTSDGRFAAWDPDGPCAAAGVGPCTFQVQSLRTEVAAAFAHSTPQSGPQTLTVHVELPSGAQVTSQPAGIDCRPTCSAPFPSGTLVTLRMSTLDFWRPACYGELDRCLIVVDAPTDVTVILRPPTVPVFTPPRGQLQVTVSGGGLVGSSDGAIRCGWAPRAQTACSEEFALTSNRTVGLRARKQGRSRLFSWGVRCRGTNPRCTVTMSRVNEGVKQFPVAALFRRR
jgi:trimeric autotransporter adhesin